eukprot:CFRG4099T1
MASLPPRWLNCPALGSPVGGTKFLPFKTPLSEKFQSEVPDELSFTPGDLFEICEENNMSLGLIIDLTKTDRYYKKQEIEEKYKCKYKKLKCDGYGEVPPDDVVISFNAICQSFWRQFPDKYIGVHCTHGFNRTGYMICSYMVDVIDMSVEDAVDFFAAARPAGIYKDHYLQKLYEKYQGDTDNLRFPGRPLWEDEDELQKEIPHTDGQTNAEGEEDIIRKRSFATVDLTAYGGDASNVDDTYELYRGQKRVRFMQGISTMQVGLHVDDTLRETIWSEVAGSCRFKNIRQFPGSQPVSMDKDNLAMLRDEPFLVSWKADGTRYLMYIRGKETYMIDRDNNVFIVQPRLIFPANEKGDTFLKNTLVDGEMVEDKDPVTGDLIPRFLIYDLIIWEGNAIGFLEPLNRRLKIAEKQVIRPRKLCMQALGEQINMEPFHLRVKKFYPIQQAAIVVNDVIPKLSHENDGLIVAPVRTRYVSGRFNKLMKWKPPELNSVDFLLKFEITQMFGERPVAAGLLFVLNYPDPVGVLKLPPKQLKELDQKVVECTWDPTQGQDGQPIPKEALSKILKENPHAKLGGWKLLRIRTDKSLPNGFKTLQGCLRSISHGLSEKELLLFVSKQAKPFHEQADNRLPEVKNPGGSHDAHKVVEAINEHPDAGEKPIQL